MRDFNAEAAALPRLSFDLLMHGYMLRTFKPHFSGVSALELGCFEGSFTALLRQEFPDVTVVDASADCIEATRNVVPDAFFINDTFEAAEPDQKFDAIVATHVLEHLDDPVVVLNRCRQWLAPQGCLFLAVPNASAASRQIAVSMGLVKSRRAVTAGEEAHGHKRTYDQRWLELHVQAAGLAIVESGGILFKPMAGFQFDAALKAGTIDNAYMEGCYAMGKEYPELCASSYVIARRKP